MGFLTRLGAIFGPTQQVSDPGGWLIRMIGGGKTKSGVAVSEFTALQLPAVYACVNRIANPVARFPVAIFRKDSQGNAVPVDDHPLSVRIGRRPNDFMSSRTLRKTSQAHALLWGNGYVEIERNGRGQAVGLFPLLPDRTRPVFDERGELIIRSTIGGENVQLAHDDVLHIMDQSYDGYVGQSPIAQARQAVGMGLAMEEFGARFFANDAKSGGFLMHPGRLGPQAIGNLKGEGKGDPKAPSENPGSRLERQGGLENAHRVKVLEEGMKFISTTIPPEDAQFLGSREFQIAEIARIFDVPLVLLQSMEKSTSWGSGIEQLMIGFVRQTIDPWVDAWEQEMNWKLFTEDEKAKGYFVKFNMNALLRGDMAARAAFYREMFGIAGITPNQICAFEDMPGMGPEGDHHFVPANFVTLERAINPPPPPAGHNGGPPLDSTEDDPPADDQDDDEDEPEREAA